MGFSSTGGLSRGIVERDRRTRRVDTILHQRFSLSEPDCARDDLSPAQEAPPETTARGIHRDGHPLDFAFQDSVLTAELRLSPGESAHISIPSEGREDSGEFHGGTLYHARVRPSLIGSLQQRAYPTRRRRGHSLDDARGGITELQAASRIRHQLHQ
jgi:hypothetical protein